MLYIAYCTQHTYLIFYRRIRTALQQQLHNLRVPLLCCFHQCRCALAILCVNLCPYVIITIPFLIILLGNMNN